MNDEKLIGLVRQHSVIYDLFNPRYMDNALKERIWKKIGKEMEVDGSTCKTRWNNMRDNYRKSLKKRLIKSGEAATQIKKYKYSQQLNFLTNYFQERESKVSIDKQEVDDADDQRLDEENDNFQSDIIVGDYLKVDVVDDNDEESGKNVPLQPTLQTSLRKRKFQPQGPTASTLTKYIISKDELTPALLPITVDPIDAFLAGIAPTLKTLTPYYLNQAKSKIFAAVQEYEVSMLIQQGQGPGKITLHSNFSTDTSPCPAVQRSSHSLISSPSISSQMQSPSEPPNYSILCKNCRLNQETVTNKP